MKLKSLRSLTGMILVSLLMSSCAKDAMDVDLQNSDLKNRDFKRGDVDFRHANFVYSDCRVRQTITRQSPGWTLTRNFVYNKNNDPVSVTSNAPGTAQPDLFFKYDKKGNLIEYYGLYWGGPAFEFLH